MFCFVVETPQASEAKQAVWFGVSKKSFPL
jgi:hypothetical protein